MSKMYSDIRKFKNQNCGWLCERAFLRKINNCVNIIISQIINACEVFGMHNNFVDKFIEC